MVEITLPGGSTGAIYLSATYGDIALFAVSGVIAAFLGLILLNLILMRAGA